MSHFDSIESLDFEIPAPPALAADLEAELGKLAPVATRRPLRQLAILFAISLVYGASLLAVTSIRKDIDELPKAWLVTAGLGWLLGFGIPAYIALVPREGAIMSRWKLAAAAACAGSFAFIALGLIVHPHGELNSLDYSESFTRGHGCLEFGLGVALAPSIIGAIFLRGVLPVGARWTAAALGASGGALGGLVLHLHCRIADQLHVGLIHGGVVIVAAVLAAALVPRATSR